MCELDVRSCEHLLGEQIKLSHIYTNFGIAFRSQFFTCKQNFEYFFACCNLNSSLEMFTRHCVPYLLIRFLSSFPFHFVSFPGLKISLSFYLPSPSSLPHPVLENCVCTCKLAIHVHRRQTNESTKRISNEIAIDKRNFHFLNYITQYILSLASFIDVFMWGWRRAFIGKTYILSLLTSIFKCDSLNTCYFYWKFIEV